MYLLRLYRFLKFLLLIIYKMKNILNILFSVDIKCLLIGVYVCDWLVNGVMDSNKVVVIII